MVAAGTAVAEVRSSPIVTRIARMKDIPTDGFEGKIAELWSEMEMGMAARKGGAA
jgi:hypothetical protein